MTQKRRPYLHIYVELNPADLGRMAVSTQILKEHLEVYFTFFDTDYRDLKKNAGHRTAADNCSEMRYDGTVPGTYGGKSYAG